MRAVISYQSCTSYIQRTWRVRLKPNVVDRCEDCATLEHKVAYSHTQKLRDNAQEMLHRHKEKAQGGYTFRNKTHVKASHGYGCKCLEEGKVCSRSGDWFAAADRASGAHAGRKSAGGAPLTQPGPTVRAWHGQIYRGRDAVATRPKFCLR